MISNSFIARSYELHPPSTVPKMWFYPLLTPVGVKYERGKGFFIIKTRHWEICNMAMGQNPWHLVNPKIAGIYGCASTISHPLVLTHQSQDLQIGPWLENFPQQELAVSVTSLGKVFSPQILAIIELVLGE